MLLEWGLLFLVFINYEKQERQFVFKIAGDNNDKLECGLF